MQYVDVAFVQDWEAERDHCGDCAGFEYDPEVPEWGDWSAMAEYMAQWDYGTETDDAHTVADDRGRRGSGPHDDVREFTIGGLGYRLATNGHLRYAALTRSPLA